MSSSTLMPPIISLHLPKSGGSSVRVCIERQFGGRAKFDYGRGPLGPHANEIEPGLEADIAVVHGHFRPARYDSVAKAFRFTILREPLDLLLSLYFFWRDLEPHNQPLHDKFLAEQPPIETFASWDKIRRFQSDTFFGGYDMARFDFIGFHERRAVDMEKLNAIAGLQLDPNQHDNVTAGGNEERLELKHDRARMARLRDLLADDVRFYESMINARS